MSKNFEERRKADKQMEENRKKNEMAKKEIQELGKLSPNGQDILKYRLWHDQQGICLYTGKTIPLEELFQPGYDIDHILPYSITFDDSYRNKVLGYFTGKPQKRETVPHMSILVMMRSVGVPMKQELIILSRTIRSVAIC